MATNYVYIPNMTSYSGTNPPFIVTTASGPAIETISMGANVPLEQPTDYSFLDIKQRGGTGRGKSNLPDIVIKLITDEHGSVRRKWYAVLIWRSGSGWIVRTFAGKLKHAWQPGQSRYVCKNKREAKASVEYISTDQAGREIAKLIIQRSIRGNRPYKMDSLTCRGTPRSAVASVKLLEQSINRNIKSLRKRHRNFSAELKTTTDALDVKSLELRVSDLSDKQLTDLTRVIRETIGSKLIEG